jgi:hypothetical protein
VQRNAPFGVVISAQGRVALRPGAPLFHIVCPLQESASFWKKKQKLLSVHVRGAATRTQMDKSFLVLFFKKELLPSFSPTTTP